MRPVILVTEPAYFKSVMRRLSAIGRVVLGSPDRRDLERRIPRCDVALIRVETALDRALIERARRLRLIASATTGINHIDADAARQRGVRILHLHGAHTRPTAEHAFALLLALARRIPAAHESMRAGRWDRARWIGRQLAGKNIGVIGVGRIGRTVARMAHAFGMNVLAYDPYVPRTAAPFARWRRTLGDLLRPSHVVTLHAALTAETRGMIGRRQFDQMRPGSLLVNTARGRIVDEAALLAALRSGRIAGAAIDVFSTEPLPRSSPLRRYARRRDNLILTPHLGASTAEAVQAAAVEMAEGIEMFLKRSVLV